MSPRSSESSPCPRSIARPLVVGLGMLTLVAASALPLASSLVDERTAGTDAISVFGQGSAPCECSCTGKDGSCSASGLICSCWPDLQGKCSCVGMN